MTIWFLAFALQAFAEKYATYFGGGELLGSHEGRFADGFVRFAALEQQGWKVDYFYNGYQKSAVELRQSINRKAMPFTDSTYYNQIQNLIKKIRHKEIKEGDEVLLYLDTHSGYDSSGRLLLGTSNGNVPMSEIENLQKATSAAGIKLGIVGLNCWAGDLQLLADQNTCVISAGARDKSSTFAFSDLFSKELKDSSGSSLENVYLRARLANAPYYSRPYISTDAGRVTGGSLDFMDELVSQPITYGVEIANDGNRCRRNLLLENIEELNKLIAADKVTRASQFIKSTQSSIKDPKDFAELLREHNEDVRRLTYILQTANGREMCAKIDANSELCVNNPIELEKFERSYQAADKALLGHDAVRMRPHIKEQLTAVEKIKKLPEYKRQMELLKQSGIYTPQFKHHIELMHEIEKQIYARMYSEEASRAEGPNPCHDFKL